VTPVEELRSAAALLRQRAEAAPKGPWSIEYFGDRGYPQRVTNAQATLIANTYEGGTGLRPIPEYIRLMNPLVGLALADLMDEHADEVDAVSAAVALDCEPRANFAELARLILRGGA